MGEIVETSVIAIVDGHVFEEARWYANVVAIRVTAVGTALSSVEGLHLGCGDATERVGHHLAEEYGVIHTDALIEHALWHILLIDEHSLDGVYVSVDSSDLPLEAFQFYSFEFHRVHGCRSQLCHHIGERGVGHPSVNSELTAVTRNFQKRVGQHGLVVFHGGDLAHLITFAHQVVVSHLVLKDMVAQEHAQRVPGVFVVIASADFNVVVACIVIPPRAGLSAFSIDLVGVGLEVGNAIDTVLSQHVIGLSKDGVSQFALLGNVKALAIVHFVEVSRADVGERVGQSRELHRLCEDGIA